MKIGKFTERNNLTIDAVRHYMALGLILPEKQGTQYDFDHRCQKDLNDIIELKEMGFTLNEIKSIFMFKRLGQLSRYQENECFKALFISKAQQISRQIEELEQMKQRLDTKLTLLSTTETKIKSEIGVDFKTLELLNCLKCGKDLMLRDGIVSNNQIINGTLGCSCGENYIIEDGILRIGNEISEDPSRFNLNYIVDYINETSSDYLDKVFSGMEWLYKKIDFNDLKGKVLLDLGSGIGFFLRTIYDSLPGDCTYIAVDHDIARHRFLKSILETTGTKKRLLFICSDFLQIPIKDGSIDVVLDISGTSNFSFDNAEFLLKLMDHYVKANASIIGTYILFKNFTSDSFIKNYYRKNFMLSNVKEQLTKLKYTIYDENISDYISEGGKYESYFKQGEKVYSYMMHGKR